MYSLVILPNKYMSSHLRSSHERHITYNNGSTKITSTKIVNLLTKISVAMTLTTEKLARENKFIVRRVSPPVLQGGGLSPKRLRLASLD